MNDSSQSESASKQSIFLAFQGGGAKGIIHIGGLLAINELELDIKGVSGTSAGSIVAALVAGGFKGIDLADPEKESNLFHNAMFTEGEDKLNYAGPHDLFTWGGWRAILIMRWTTLLFTSLFGMADIRPVPRRLYSLYLLMILMSLIHWLVEYFPHVFACLCALFIGFIAAALVGFTTVRKVRMFIDGVLARKVREQGVNKEKDVTFLDLQRAGFIPLKIIATNTTSESLELFCVDRTPWACVADAVAASICLPFIFRPWCFSFMRNTIRDVEEVSGRFFDGGLVSNLPAWPFDEERLLYPDVPTVALSIEPASELLDKHWLPSIVNTIINGTGEIHTRAVGPIIKILLKTDLGTLDFDVAAYRAYREIRESKKNVATQLGKELISAPKALNKAAAEIHNGIEQLVSDYEGLLFDKKDADRIRVAIAVQRGGALKSLSLVFLAGYTRSDTDMNLTIPLDAPFVKNPRNCTDAIFGEISEVTRKSLFASERIWPDVQWVLSIPLVYKHPSDVEISKIRKCGILIDSNIQINYKLAGVEGHLSDFVQRATLLVREYNKFVGIEEFVQGPNTWL